MFGVYTMNIVRELSGHHDSETDAGSSTSCTSSSTLDRYASSPSGAADRGIATSIFCCAAALMLSRR